MRSQMTIKPSLKRPPMRVRRIIMACVRGQTLVKTMRNRPGFPEVGPVYTMEPAGRAVAEFSALDAIASGLLVANEDGLFPGSSQTWRAAPGAEKACEL